jgi:C_GCAxxG_C_C family probable redox protein
MTDRGKFEIWVKNLSGDEKMKLMQKIEEDAVAAEMAYYGCSRCVLHAVQKNLKLGNGDAIKAVMPLAGGVARSMEACGALLGAVMATGLAYGSDKLAFAFQAHVKDRPQDDEVAYCYAETMRRGGIICDKFRDKYGSLRCIDVQKAVHGKYWNLKDPKQLAEYCQPSIHNKCGYVAGFAARIAAEVILA